MIAVVCLRELTFVRHFRSQTLSEAVQRPQAFFSCGVKSEKTIRAWRLYPSTLLVWTPNSAPRIFRSNFCCEVHVKTTMHPVPTICHKLTLIYDIPEVIWRIFRCKFHLNDWRIDFEGFAEFHGCRMCHHIVLDQSRKLQYSLKVSHCRSQSASTSELSLTREPLAVLAAVYSFGNVEGKEIRQHNLVQPRWGEVQHTR